MDVWVGVATGRGSDRIEGGQWPGESIVDVFLEAGQVPPSLPGCHCSGKGHTGQIPSKHMLPADRQRVGSGPAGPFLGKGTGTFPSQSSRLRDQEIQESGTFQDLTP